MNEITQQPNDTDLRAELEVARARALAMQDALQRTGKAVRGLQWELRKRKRRTLRQTPLSRAIRHALRSPS